MYSMQNRTILNKEYLSYFHNKNKIPKIINPLPLRVQPNKIENQNQKKTYLKARLSSIIMIHSIRWILINQVIKIVKKENLKVLKIEKKANFLKISCNMKVKNRKKVRSLIRMMAVYSVFSSRSISIFICCLDTCLKLPKKELLNIWFISYIKSQLLQ